MAPESATDPELLVRATGVQVDAGRLHVLLASGEDIGVPLDRFPRLAAANAEDLAAWEIVAGGTMISWANLDEDLSVFGLLPATIQEALSAFTRRGREASPSATVRAGAIKTLLGPPLSLSAYLYVPRSQVQPVSRRKRPPVTRPRPSTLVG